jgi:hypothetical protein
MLLVLGVLVDLRFGEIGNLLVGHGVLLSERR